MCQIHVTEYVDWYIHFLAKVECEGTDLLYQIVLGKIK